jgi:hypothetical protein
VTITGGFMQEEILKFDKKPPKGYRLLKGNELLMNGDLHFDIYNGWESDGDVKYGKRYATTGGRWIAWARKS